ncbi:hypothetical protein DM02DRAFT_661109 [Periconia macrospinosa]|uniref:Autophagy-related protein 2 n=1 Tax=Periconia macrospinosa TaxID=97972 RepID=A0A2V1D8D2_9PLEO|nr:hypothetical protein DM02DRAFT_661109 [Periconia macrospinosa]
MAFLLGFSSSIGKRLLLFGLRHIDILDKDPADFVNVDVGKETTLRMTDKLTALLHVKLPPGIQISEARASLFRVTVVLEFGVPQIIVEIDGIKVHAKIAQDPATPESKSRGTERSQPRARSPSLRSPRGHVPIDEQSDSEDEDENHVPTVDDLAESFIREESEEEIKELEHQLEAQSANLQDSVSSSDDDDESVTGMGAPLALPTYLRNLLNTALDRLKIVINDIDIEMEDHFSSESPNDVRDEDTPYVSLNFHVNRVSMDSVLSEEARIDVTASTQPAQCSSKLGKRRLRLEKICARMVSDAENFISLPRVSRPSSPEATRSVASTNQESHSEPAPSSARPALNSQDSPTHSKGALSPAHPPMPESSSSMENSVMKQASESTTLPSRTLPPFTSEALHSSVHTTDEDRFADVGSDDEQSHSIMSESQGSIPIRDMTASSVLYDDEGLLEYAMQNQLLDPQIEQGFDSHYSASQQSHNWGLDGVGASQMQTDSYHESDVSTSDLPTASALHRLSSSTYDGQASQISTVSEQPQASVAEMNQIAPADDEAPLKDDLSDSSQTPSDELSESRIFSHEDAESMYMSAMSAPMDASHHAGVPGGWDSSSEASSHGASSDVSAPVPDSMIAGSILEPTPETDDSCATPRPASPQSVFSSPVGTRQTQPGDRISASIGSMPSLSKLAKRFLTIDEVTVWFPLGLAEDSPSSVDDQSEVAQSGFDFTPPNLAEDSIFQGMPGSFSNYAHSTSARKNPSMEASARRRPAAKPAQTEKPAAEKKAPSSAISVDVGTISGHIDFSTGLIMYQMLTRALSAFAGEPPAEKKSRDTENPSVEHSSRSSFELSIKLISISMRERLLTESLVLQPSSLELLDTNPLDAILKVRLSTLYAASQNSVEDLRAKLRIGQFTLSSLDHDIVAFQDSRPKPRRSVGSADIEIDYEQAQDRRLTVVTRPVKVMFDLQKLDLALGSFGGFSGVLELSSSFSSPVISPIASPNPSKPRGVHFRDMAPAPPPTDQSKPSSMPKIDVQFGEVALTLKGKSCAVKLNTTSVRLAIRESNVRMKVSEIQLSGPYTDLSSAEAALAVKMESSTLTFLFAPREEDLGRLLAMITPSKDKYENDDDILVDTLLRQRRKGSVLRAEVAGVGVRVSDPTQMHIFEALGAEVAMLSRVTKYLPDDDRPGILTLATVNNVDLDAFVNERLGDISVSLANASVAHVGVPSLFAAEIGGIFVQRDQEVLVHEVVELRGSDHLPMAMVRFVGDEMEPVIKAKFHNLCVEYYVSTVMAALGISADGTMDDIATGLASSIATVTRAVSPTSLSRQTSVSTSSSTKANKKPLHIDVLFRHCALGLNPNKLPAKGLFVLTDAHFLGKQSKQSDFTIQTELRKASVHAIDDVARFEEKRDKLPVSPVPTKHQLAQLLDLGYVSMSSISAAKVLVNITGDGKDQPQLVDVEFKNELFVLESCADSTQTLIQILNGLQPPRPPSTAERYRTVVPLQEMMESFTGDAIDTEDAIEEENFMENADLVADEVPTNLEFVGSFYNQESLPTEEELADSLLDEDDLGVLAAPPAIRQRGERGVLESFQEQYEVAEGEEDFDFDDNYFKGSDSEVKGKARKWDSTKNRYHLSNEYKVSNAPLKVRIRDVNVIWNLYDGYDWPATRAVIAQAVEDVETRAEERRRRHQDEEEEDDFVEEDFLFNSVWIGVPVKDDTGGLARQINREIDDQVSETGSYATSTATRSSNATIRPRSATKSTKGRLKLQRSRHKKIAIELMGVAVDFVVYPPDTGETLSSVDVRVQDFEIFDHVPQSAWRKFLTCTIERSQREINRPMVNLELLTVKPTEDLAASDLVIRVTILPLRLHVDQYALEFITRFFEFKNDSDLPNSAPAEQPFIQRLEVNAVQMKLDYKPRHVDYRGLRSGHTTEFMNFLMLDESNITLRHAIVYGISSFDKLHKTLNDVWMPDVKRNQLPGVLAGLAVVRPIVNVGSGVRDLVVVPMREYKKDGRIVRSLQKGVYAFATNTTAEVARLGAKVAIGAQNILEGTEKMLGAESSSSATHTRSSSTSHHHDWDGDDPSSSDTEEPRPISNYAHQPLGVRAGLRSAARHLERDLLTARDAVIAIPSEVMEEGSGVGAAKAVAKRAPTILLRPALGATKLVSNALLGVGNALDPQSARKIGDKYKSY